MTNDTPNEPVEDGGPAFPLEFVDQDSKDQIIFCGVSIRDYFAAKAIPMFLAKTISAPGDVDDMIRACAKGCYKIADAMIAERER